jgi:uncharacterized protein (TIGR00369 family)
MPNMQAYIQSVLRGEITVPVAQLVGFRLVSAEGGQAAWELEAGPQHTNPMGTLHGGVLCDIADAAMGMALASLLSEGETFTTLELKINFLRPVWQGRLRAKGRVVRPGRTISLVECDVLDDEDRLVARASSTCMTLRGEAAEGR